ncbi:bifunctional proline dehydrogenase/L-glutamate gamma-semialdehyde dehydrogenase PutA [Nitrosococcus oceani]|uniref:bifunctional proline dehydrogenase/L-glutamate gamma-semialdehyde dehydrogenase PutA n=1 Tax=Nitrosococcus oceani TaxID=1229 RepID=UPI0004E8EC3E|nr:bifunctional proline dehydrogenase/L-glutamate gamma-semialdehyde dehydrogenase PutA [Nitrosococcus oceani]KFI22672.1 integrase [Nitrosococcus oceani]
MISDIELPSLDSPRAAISAAYLADETVWIKSLLRETELPPEANERVKRRASQWVQLVREKRRWHGGLDAFLHEYNLSSQEGVVLMCLAEALLRIPDDENADRLIHDKLLKGEWDRHLGHSHSLFVNASTWGLMLTGRLMRLETPLIDDGKGVIKRLVKRGGEPLVRLALRQAMRIIGGQFIMAPRIEQALTQCRENERYSFDMLGEVALTQARVEQYYSGYRHAIRVLGETDSGEHNREATGISVKLSALHPRYTFSQRRRVQAELVPRVLALAREACAADIGLTLDAEEADRLELMLDVFEAVFRDPSLRRWQGFGLALQAYQKRALPVLNYLRDLAQKEGRCIPVRLVKGAYWDTEIKRAQEQGLAGYPVFTRKVNTDVSFLALARRLLSARDVFYPQFASHNAHTVAWVLETAGEQQGFEFQRLYGMGELLYSALREQGISVPCRVYAPVGGYADLLPYLVRRLLENGANTSFVNRIEDEEVPIEQIVADPSEYVRSLPSKSHPNIPLPLRLYGKVRRNSLGINLNDPTSLERLMAELGRAMEKQRQALPLVSGEAGKGTVQVVRDPSDRRRVLGTVVEADQEAIAEALSEADAVAAGWEATSVLGRAECLEQAADLFEERQVELMALCIREGGKTVADSLAEVREAVDACRYYAAEARRLFAMPKMLPGPTGEHNELTLHGRGVFVCISPWNFPLAIFTGQVAAALVAGNTVIAKPAGQTPLIAALVVQWFHEAGIPPRVLHFLPGRGSRVGQALVADYRISGVAFTGSTRTAAVINQVLAERKGPIVPLIAETGGQNAMIVDSSALPEQVVVDVMTSAFNSAGQRCSALRVLFLQEEVAEPILEMLIGAMEELRLGEPGRLDTDIGPLIDGEARARLETHCQRMNREARLLCRLSLPEATQNGYYFPPRVYELENLAELTYEVFGPVLHVIRYSSKHLNKVIASINRTGYGLTLGIHSRVDETVRYIQNRVHAGNIYVNRNMIGAVVGVQPFGGERLSGTGPKAGGPHYLLRFATERSTSINMAAVGGNTDLLSLGE